MPDDRRGFVDQVQVVSPRSILRSMGTTSVSRQRRDLTGTFGPNTMEDNRDLKPADQLSASAVQRSNNKDLSFDHVMIEEQRAQSRPNLSNLKHKNSNK